MGKSIIAKVLKSDKKLKKVDALNILLHEYQDQNQPGVG
jgi:hypothetical protein